MRIVLLLLIITFVPLSASAQLIIQQGKSVSDASANDTSMKPPVAPEEENGPVEAVIQGTNFPAAAITPVGNGRNSNEPVNVATRKIIDAESPLWPTDTVDIFVNACAGTRHELVTVCRCIIERTALSMPHNQFVKLSEAGEVENDGRYITARQECMQGQTGSK